MKVAIHLIVSAFLLFSGGLLKAQKVVSYKVIVNSSNSLSTIKKGDLSKFFLKKKQKWPDGKDVLCVDLAVDSSIRKKFSKQIHGRTVSAIKAYWQKQIFSGRGVPHLELDSEAKILKYIHAHPTAIGYVAAPASLSKFKVKVINIEE